MPSTSLLVARLEPDTLPFLRELAKHNEKPWFDAHKPRYEKARDSMVAFIEAAGLQLRRISPHVVADARPTGGSLMRIYRDIRFSRDKTPYKTSLSMHFWHAKGGREMRAPGFYLHVEPGNTFAAAGLWRPDSVPLGQIRMAIAADPKGWAKAKGKLVLEGDSLQRVPKPFPADHPHADDLRRKDITPMIHFTDKQVASPEFLATFVAACKSLAPVNAFLCKAMDVAW